MKKMFLAIVALLVIGGVVLFMNLGGVVKRTIELAGSHVLGTKVSVSGLDISLANKTAAMRGLSVANPSGFSGALLKTKGISVAVGDVSKDVVIIKSVVVDGMDVTYEFGAKGSNFEAIQKNLKTAAAEKTPAPAAKKADGAKSADTRIVIQHLKIVNAHVIPSLGAVSTPVSLPDIVLKNIGSQKNPATASDVALQVMNKVMAVSAQAVVQAGIVNGLTGGAGGIVGGVLKSGAASGAVDSVKGLFSGGNK